MKLSARAADPESSVGQARKPDLLPTPTRKAHIILARRPAVVKADWHKDSRAGQAWLAGRFQRIERAAPARFNRGFPRCFEEFPVSNPADEPANRGPSSRRAERLF